MPIPGDRTEALNVVKRLFWDKPLGEGDFDEYPLWVVARVLDYGDLPDVHALIELYGRQEFLHLVAQARFSSRLTENFWRQILESEGIPCAKRSFPREDAGSWMNWRESSNRS